MLPYLRREGKERPPFSPTVGQARSGFPRERSSRSLYFSTRSVGVLGSAARNSHSRGTWNFASRSAANARSSSSATGSLATTNALISCPSTGSGTPITAASATRGCSRRVFSISTEETFSPPRRITSLAVDEVEPAVLVDEAEVAGQEPAVAERRHRRLGVPQVRGQARGRADRGLARPPRGERAPVIVEDAERDARHRRAARPRAPGGAEGRDGDHAGVGRAEALGHVRDLEAAHHLVADGCG